MGIHSVPRPSGASAPRSPRGQRFDTACARTCRSVDCFREYGWDWAAACADPRWVCAHCREVCPRCAVANPYPADASQLTGSAAELPAAELARAKRTAEYWTLLKMIEEADLEQKRRIEASERAAAPADSPAPAGPLARGGSSAMAARGDAAHPLGIPLPRGGAADRLACWSSPAAGGDAWGHESGAGGIVQLREGSGRVHRLFALVGGRRASSISKEASHGLN